MPPAKSLLARSGRRRNRDAGAHFIAQNINPQWNQAFGPADNLEFQTIASR
jgi:hypothetical protein